MTRKTAFIPVLLGAFALGACDDVTSSNDLATLRVELTDAPSDYVAAAHVEIGRIEVLSADGERHVVTEDGGTYDLLTLQNGVTAELGAIDVEPGLYTEVRMIVERAEITLAGDYTFTDGSQTKEIKVPSGAETGIKVKLFSGDGESEGVHVRPGETVLVVDFDVSQNFVMQGDAETPAGIKGFIFTPTLRAAVKDVAGSIAGTVTAPDSVDVGGLSVTATRANLAEGEAPATTLLAGDGTFKVNFLVPGEYAVTVVAPEGFVADTANVTVSEAEAVTGVSLTIEEPTE